MNEPVNAQYFVVSDGTSQCFYVGKVQQSDFDVVKHEGIGEELQLVLDTDGYITLFEARCIRALMVPTPEGIQLSNTVMSIGMARDALTIRIRPTMSYWVGQSEPDLDLLIKHIGRCERQEQEHRAQAAGIALVKPGIGRLTE